MNNLIPVKQGEKYELNISRLGTSAEGIGNIEGFTVFVPYALPGERVCVVITDVKKTYAIGKLLKIFTKSKERVVPKCPIYEKCGGCQMQHLSYAAQLHAKRQQVIDAVKHIGGMATIPVMSTIGATNPWNYRNKMQFPIGKNKGKIFIGCYEKATHNIIDADSCAIQNTLNNEVVTAVKTIVERLAIAPYDEDKHIGILRHVVGRVGKNGDTMIVLVTATRELSNVKAIVNALRKRLPKLVSVQQNIQTYHNNVIMGRETKLLWGKPTIIDSIDNLMFHISPRSFFQVNTEQAGILYRKTLEYANLKGEEVVIDAYCGTGTISLFLARKAYKVYGIEIVKPAILDARKNAFDNNVRNAEFIVGDATEVMPRLYHQGIRPDVIVVDPPRAGCSQQVLETFANMKPERIVYVSCNPATLARDLKRVATVGYIAEKIQPVDMFPMTSHVETVVLLRREK